LLYNLSLRVPQKEVRWSKVCGSWWPKTVPDNAITEDVLLEGCYYCCMGSRRIFLKPGIPFIHFQQGNKMSIKFGKLSAVIASSNN
jgi:hypothetical protein